MQDFEHTDLPEDNEVEISDLDTPDERKNSSPIYRILERARKIHLSPRTRIRLFVLALLLGGCVLAYQFIPSPRSKTTTVGYISSSSSMQIVTNPTDPAINISVANGIAYILTQDGTLNAQRASDGKLLWQNKVPISSSQGIVPPTIADNLILFTSQISKSGHVDALRASDGTLQWSFQTSTLASPAPLMVEDAVAYILTHNGTIYALNANNGHLLWKFATRLSMPLANLLYSSNGVTAVLSDTNTAYLLRTQDGSQLWHYTFDNYNTSWMPYINGGIAYIHSNENVLQARRLSDGKFLWQYTAHQGNEWSFTLQDRLFYVNTGNGAIEALSEQDGTQFWQFQTKDGIQEWRIHNGFIFLTSSNGYFEVVRASDGSLLWKFKASSYSNISWFIDTPDGLVHILVDQPAITLYTLRANDGKIIWQQPLNNFDKNSFPETTNTALYIRQSDGSIDAWRGSDGHHLWHYQPSTPVTQETAADGMVYMQQEDGTISVLQAQDGKVAWSYPDAANP